AKREDVERDLQLLLGVDVAGAMCAAELVVLHDASGAERIDVDPVDLPGDGEATELEAPLQLDRRRARAEADLEPPRDEWQAELELLLDEMLEVARQGLLQLEPLQVGELHAHPAGDCLGEAFAQEDERLVQAVGLDRIRPEPLRQAAVEAVERLVRDSAANARIEDGVDLLRVNDALEEPHRGAIEEALELRDREAGALGELLDDERMGKRRLAVEGGEGALDAPLPAVRQRERAGLVLVRRGDRGRRAQAFALGRAALELPGETGEGTLLRRECNVGRVEPR